MELLHDAGLDVEAIAAAAGIDPALLDNAEGRVTTEMVSAVWRAAVEISGDPAICMVGARAPKPGNFNVVGFAMLSSRNLYAALHSFSRYMRLVSDAAQIEIDALVYEPIMRSIANCNKLIADVFESKLTADEMPEEVHWVVASGNAVRYPAIQQALRKHLAVPFLDTTFVVLKRLKYHRPVYEADAWHFHHRMANIGFSQRRTLLYLYGWTLVLALLALALRFVPYSDDRGNFDPLWTTIMAVVLLAALAVTVYLAFVLEIIKRPRWRDEQNGED